ncbi:MAG: MIP family channel protein [Actinomycetota bacterium]
MARQLIRKLLAEFVGALTLIFIGAGSQVAVSTGVVGAGLVTIALAHGLAIATMVSAVGHVSGGHFNPAVTIGALVTGKIDPRDAAAYVVSQLTGAATGAALLAWSVPESIWRKISLGTPAVSRVTDAQAVLIEAVLTFFLVWVVFATAIDEEGAFGKVAGLAIGFVITMDVLAGGPFTGAAMNPARAFGPALLSGFWVGHWVYWVGPIAGGVVAAGLYQLGVLAPATKRPPRRKARSRR